MMPTSSPAPKLALTPSTAVRPPKRTVTSRASSRGTFSGNSPLPGASFVARLVAAPLVAPPPPPFAGVAPPGGERAPAQRRQPARQVQHREDQQQPERHHVDLRRVQAQCLGQQAEHHRS